MRTLAIEGMQWGDEGKERSQISVLARHRSLSVPKAETMQDTPLNTMVSDMLFVFFLPVS